MINIAIIDDEPLVRASIQSFLDWESYGFSFTGEASDGIEGLELIKSNRNIDLILLDIHMPGMNGIEFLEELKNIADAPGVIVLSANDQYEYVRDSFRLGALDYILKMNIDENTLLELLQKIVKSSDFTREALQTVNSKDVEYMQQKLIQDLLNNRNIDLTLSLMKDIDIELRPPVKILYFWLNNSELDSELEENFDIITIQGRQFLKKRGEGCITAIGKCEWLFLINERENSDSSMEIFCRDFVRVISNNTGVELGYAVSPTCSELEKLSEYYKYVKSIHQPESRMVRKAKEYIRKNFSRHSLSLDDISDFVEVSRTHLSSQFKKESDITITAYMTKVRIDEAKKLLLETNLKVYEVSEKVGYPNVEHFSRVFKKETKLTPNKFAREVES